MLYAIETVGWDAMKIGFSTDLRTLVRRIEGLQVGSPHELAFLGVMLDGTRADEKRMHLELDNVKIRGEWYSRRKGWKLVEHEFRAFQITARLRQAAYVVQKVNQEEPILDEWPSEWVSLSDRIREDLETKWEDVLSTSANEGESDESDRALEALESCSAAERQLLTAVAEGRTFQELGNQNGVSHQAIQKRFSKLASRLRKRAA